MIFRVLFILMISINVAHAQGLKLSLPLDCVVGEDCWIARYNDVDPESGKALDFTCERRTSDGHEGVDFAIRSRLEMKEGVDVLAAADGKVLRFRDGESDSIKTDAQIEAISAANKDCGNGVIIQHTGGLQSFYCHLKVGSIVVKSGDDVAAGQKIGQVGQSGAASYPHLHFSVISAEGRIDPFTGLSADQGCHEKGTAMWSPEIPYQDFAAYDGGFLSAVPDFKAIEAGQEIVKTLPSSSQNLVFWIGFYHGQAGDRVDMKITAPDGSIVAERTAVMEKDRARQYFYTGKKLRADLPKGIYKGEAAFYRAGAHKETFAREVLVE